MLRVTNNSGNDLADRYNGIDYLFPAGSSVALDEDAARHIFGFGDGDKVPYLVRQGWMRSTGEYENAMAILAGFSFAAYDIPVAGEIVQQPITEQINAPEEVEEQAADPVPDALVVAASGPKGSILDKLAGNVG